MKIKFKNGSYLKSIKSNDIKRSSRADNKGVLVEIS